MPAPAPRPPQRDPDRSSPTKAVAGIGAALLVIVCCAGPALIAAGALAGLGAWLSSPWAIAAAVPLAVIAAATVIARRRKRRDACCPPTPSSTPDRPDHAAGPTSTEGRHHR